MAGNPKTTRRNLKDKPKAKPKKTPAKPKKKPTKKQIPYSIGIRG